MSNKLSKKLEIAWSTAILIDCFKDFEQNNKSFHYEIELDFDIPSYIMLDFSIEDFDKDGSYIANITYLGSKYDNNKTPSIDKFRQSETARTAREIVRTGVKKGLSNGSVGRWDESSESPPDLSSMIVYNPEARNWRV